MTREHGFPAARRDEAIQAVLNLAQSCHYEVEHSHQVTRLALRLFDELQSLHRLGAEERFWLQCGALLHDIGWIEGQKGHHKASLRIILKTSLLPFGTRERYLIGSIARYHRKATPSAKHAHFSALRPSERQAVCFLAAILRIADGLDRTHRSVVQDVQATVTPKRIALTCTVSDGAEAERETALEKGALLAEVTGRKLEIEMVRGEDTA